MLRLHLDPYGTPSEKKIARAVDIIHRGGVAAYPTDTVYGLGCALEAKKAAERIYQAKQMNKNQRLALVCPDLSTASEFGHFSQKAFRLAQRIFPGPYTLIVSATREVPKLLLDKKRRTVGIRIPDHPIVQAMLQKLGRPMLTSSAIGPISGQPCTAAEDFIEEFGRCVDVLIECEETSHEPSTVIEIDNDEITVLREGRGPIDDIFI